ncbi:MAG: GNAT family protein [Lentisphaeria bacterium]
MMKLIFDKMSAVVAAQISRWIYPEPYSIYNLGNNDACHRELLGGLYFSAHDENGTLWGYYCVGKAAQVPAGGAFGVYDPTDRTDIGLGMNPSFCGLGRGADFVTQGLTFVQGEFSVTRFRLTVASFNLRAIKVYEQTGFTQMASFVRVSKPGKMKFLVMEKGVGGDGLDHETADRRGSGTGKNR